MTASRRSLIADPRNAQILALSGLLGFGIVARGFPVDAATVAVIVGTALFVQGLGSFALGAWQGRKAFLAEVLEPRSALITSLSLSILLRTSALELAALAALLAIGSKFLIRMNGVHIFNPANFALVVLLLATDAVWVSPGQWGTEALLIAAFVMAGILVLSRAGRLDTALIFIVAYGACLIARALWLGDPLTIPAHQLQSGALLLFTCFMITDPKTTPASRGARAIFAVAVAVIGYQIQFRFFVPEGLFYALFLVCLARPILDRLMPAEAYQWSAPRALINLPGALK